MNYKWTIDIDEAIRESKKLLQKIDPDKIIYTRNTYHYDPPLRKNNNGKA